MNSTEEDRRFDELERSIDADGAVGAGLRSLSTRARFVSAVGAVLALLVLVFGAFGRPDWEVYPIGRLAAELFLLTMTTLATLWLALRPLYLPPPRVIVVAVVGALAMALPIAFALFPEAHDAHPASHLGGGDDPVVRALTCLGFGTLAALPMLALCRVLDRLARLSSGALFFAGLVGVLALHLHCPVVDRFHLVVGHATVVAAVVVVVAGANALRRLAVRSSR